MYNWKVKHTVIDGRRQYFDGTAMQLFGNWIKWWFFTIITIWDLCVLVKYQGHQWITKHTHFID